MPSMPGWMEGCLPEIYLRHQIRPFSTMVPHRFLLSIKRFRSRLTPHSLTWMNTGILSFIVDTRKQNISMPSKLFQEIGVLYITSIFTLIRQVILGILTRKIHYQDSTGAQVLQPLVIMWVGGLREAMH